MRITVTNSARKLNNGRYFLPVLLLFIFCGICFGQEPDAQKRNWLLGAKAKLERIRDASIADVQKCEREIQKSESTMRKSEDLIRQAKQRDNAPVEAIARQASSTAKEAIIKNRQTKNVAERNRKRAEEALAYLKAGGKDLESRIEQLEREDNVSDWTRNQKRLIDQRLTESNKWCSGIYTSLKTEAPPLPYKKFDELLPGDALLFAGSKLITGLDDLFSGDNASNVSHTVLYLKEINGVKLFLDSQPGEGTRIVPEAYVLNKYGSRDTEVAKLAQPLNKEEADRLYLAAKEMRAANINKIKADNWFDKTDWGVWKKENVVCSEADWALIRASGRDIPKSEDRVKTLGVDFSPADFYGNEQYFLVSPLAMPKK